MTGNELKYAHLARRNRDEAESLFLANMNLAPSVLRKIVGKSGMNEDLMQDAYLGLWRACIHWRESEEIKFSAYAGRCIVNACTQHHRGKKKSVVPERYLSERAYPNIDKDESEVTLEEIVPDDSAGNTEERIAFKDFINRLDDDERDIAIALMNGRTLKSVYEAKGRTWCWGKARKEKLGKKLMEAMA